MINRKVLYGYQIQNGTLEIVPEEQRAVSMVFTLYNAGASYHRQHSAGGCHTSRKYVR